VISVRVPERYRVPGARSRRRVLCALAIVLGGACSRQAAGPSSRPVTDVALRAELLRRAANDQAIREQYASVLRQGKQPDSTLLARMASVDATNTRWLADVVARRGWPGRTIVGEDGADAAFLLVQHADADTAFQVRALPLLARAYRAGEATGQQFALLTDRVATARGQPQVYGTQARFVAGRTELKPIGDSAGVDARRASVGLLPLRDYLRLVDSMQRSTPAH
jgi:hypothetical protein